MQDETFLESGGYTPDHETVNAGDERLMHLPTHPHRVGANLASDALLVNTCADARSGPSFRDERASIR